MSINASKKTDEESWEPESALDILLALLFAEGKNGICGEPIEGITRLDKLMFLLSKDRNFTDIINKGYTFEADNFGPFAPELFDDIEALKHENVLKIISSRNPSNITDIADEEVVLDPSEDADPSDTSFRVQRYQLTDEGLEIAKFIWKGLSDVQRNSIISLKGKWQDQSLTELLHYVYRRYPETTVKSKIKEQILTSR